jgi:pilus assembly protein CpaB
MRWKSGLLRLFQSTLTLAVLALLGGLLAAASGRHYLQQRSRQIDAEAAQRYSMLPVIVAKRDLASGERLDPDSLAVRPVPTTYLPAGSFAAGAAAALLGRRLSSDLKRGEALQSSTLQPALVSLSHRLPAGIRALTVAVDDLNSHSGLLRAGDSVDVYLVEREGARSRIGLLQEQLQVLATGSRTVGQASTEGENAPQDFGTVTLQVDDNQAQRLVLARQAGDLSFVLRAVGDESPAPVQQLDSRYLINPATRSAGTRPPRNHQSDAIELLIGGGGGPAPARHWLRVASPGLDAGGA